jgi:hypothetical protein
MIIEVTLMVVDIIIIIREIIIIMIEEGAIIIEDQVDLEKDIEVLVKIEIMIIDQIQLSLIMRIREMGRRI